MGTRVVFSNIRNEILQQIENAQKEVIIAVAWFTDIRIIDSLLEKIQKDNIKVWILFYDDKINKKELYKDLYKAGATIRYTKTMMHNKFCVIDKNIVINGSYNWTQNAHSNNRENVQISNNDVNLANSFIREFNKLSKDAVNYYCYVTKHETIKAQIESNLDTFYRDYKGLFQEPEKYPCIMEIPKVYIEEDKYGFIYFNSFAHGLEHSWRDYSYSAKGVISIPIYILLKNKIDLTELINALFSYEKSNFKYWLFKDTDEILQSLLNDSRERTVNSSRVRNTNTAFNYPVILKLYGVSDDEKSEEFAVNDLNYRYVYPKNKFFIVRREEKEQFDAFRNKKETIDIFILELIKPNGEVLKRVDEADFNSLDDFRQFKKVEGGFASKRIAFYDNENDYVKVKITYSWSPERLVFNHIIVSNYIRIPYLKEVKEYNIIDYSGKFILPYYGSKYTKENYGYICYKMKDQYTVEFLYGYYGGVRDISDKSNNDIWDALYNKPFHSYYKRMIYNLKTKELIDLDGMAKEEERRKMDEKYRNDGCYIATMAYQDINHPKVQVFRMFRDNTLVNYEAGRRFISFYYAHSPSWVKVLKGKKRINYVIRKLLDGMVYFICRLYKIDFDSVNKK